MEGGVCVNNRENGKYRQKNIRETVSMLQQRSAIAVVPYNLLVVPVTFVLPSASALFPHRVQ